MLSFEKKPVLSLVELYLEVVDLCHREVSLHQEEESYSLETVP